MGNSEEQREIVAALGALIGIDAQRVSSTIFDMMVACEAWPDGCSEQVALLARLATEGITRELTSEGGYAWIYPQEQSVTEENQ